MWKGRRKEGKKNRKLEDTREDVKRKKGKREKGKESWRIRRLRRKARQIRLMEDTNGGRKDRRAKGEGINGKDGGVLEGEGGEQCSHVIGK